MTAIKSVFLTFFLTSFIFSLNGQDDPETDSLERVLNTDVHDTVKLSLLQKISFRTVGSNPNKAIEYSLRGVALAQKYDNQQAVAHNYNNLGSGYQSKGEYENAMSAYLKAIIIHEKLNDDAGCAQAYSNIGFIFRRQQNYDKAIEFHEKARKLYQNIGDRSGAAGCLVNIGNVYYSKGDYDSAIERYQESLLKYMEIGDKESIATIENNIGAVYFEKGDFEKANEYFLKSYVIREQSQNKYEMATSLNNIGEVFGKLGNYAKAIEYCTKSLKLAEEIGAKDIMVYNYGNLAGLSSFAGKFEQAYEYQLLASELKDSILTVENNLQMNELSVKYETEKKEAENKVLRAEGERQRAITIAVTSGLLLAALLLFFIFRGYRLKKRANEQLEKKQLEIVSKNFALENANKTIHEKNKDITDSIRYAKRLQSAILKPETDIKDYFTDAFIFFKPKDIVSGDFYWFEKFGRLSMVAAADCTGHGVPGAFMSIIGCNLLSQAVNEYAITQPAAILNSVNKGLSKVLQQKTDKIGISDGMDVALCSFNPDKMMVEYAGAFNPLWIFRDGKLIEFKANKFPVGAFVDNQVRIFNNHEIPVLPGDMLYLFSDGFADQFGGPAGKKFKYKQLQQLLSENISKTAAEQRSVLEASFSSWTGDFEQIDDVLIIGIRI